MSRDQRAKLGIDQDSSTISRGPALEQNLLPKDRVPRVRNYSSLVLVLEYHLLLSHLFQILVDGLPSQLRPIEDLSKPNSDCPSSEVAASFLQDLKGSGN